MGAIRQVAAATALGCMCALGALSGTMAQTADQPPPDPSRIITLQLENDATAGTDRYYTAGAHLGYTLPSGELPDMLARFGHEVFGAGSQRLSLGLSQLLFTPRNTQIAPPDPNDRPYAGLLIGDLGLIQDTNTMRSVLDLSLGVIGPAALGRQIQNGFHHLIGETPNRGWAYQLPNQPVFELTATRIWRVPVAAAGPLGMDVLPTVAAGVGLWRDYALAGAQVRVGQNLEADFGAPRMEPGMTGFDAYNPRERLAWYVFAGIDGQAVAFDETIDGEPFRSTAHVTRIPFVGEFQAGLAVMAFGLRLTFSDVVQTRAFHGQQGRLFQFGSAAVSLRF